MSTFTNTFDYIGFIGTCVFPVATAFQAWKLYATQSADDISYGWQLGYMLAAILCTIYSIHYHLWAIASPLALDVVLMVGMIGVKVYLDMVPSTASPAETGVFISAAVARDRSPATSSLHQTHSNDAEERL
eukprot:TRINITY_DN16507_c0_g3_i1.p1 TRINITY_DN16507_c0_g3~~TRINITY_DN16507_c0_g3_i1.p1  ORF type:complete len:131 (+),score=14.57 TRINITY_DN16507_c0_g3_i1:609-1001(+)